MLDKVSVRSFGQLSECSDASGASSGRALRLCFACCVLLIMPVPAKYAAGAARDGSHAGAWEPSNYRGECRMRTLLAVLLLAWTTLPHAAQLLELRIGEHSLQAEYATTLEERRRGLMGRQYLAADQGMLFRFDEVRRHCLWMKNTPLPLSAAFIDEDGVIVDLIDLEPLSETIRCSREPARYALEVNQGWFEARGAGPGLRVEGLPGQ